MSALQKKHSVRCGFRWSLVHDKEWLDQFQHEYLWCNWQSCLRSARVSAGHRISGCELVPLAPEMAHWPRWSPCWSEANLDSFLYWSKFVATEEELVLVACLPFSDHRCKIDIPPCPPVRLTIGSRVVFMPSKPCTDIGCARCLTGQGGWKWGWIDRRWTPVAAMNLSITKKEHFKEEVRHWPMGVRSGWRGKSMMLAPSLLLRLPENETEESFRVPVGYDESKRPRGPLPIHYGSSGKWSRHYSRENEMAGTSAASHNGPGDWRPMVTYRAVPALTSFGRDCADVGEADAASSHDGEHAPSTSGR